MEISTATATEMQNNFGKYLSLVMACLLYTSRCV